MSTSSKNKKPESIQVRNTGDWSSGSKLCCIKNQLWNDPYFEIFNYINPVPKRTSLICNGYYVRYRVCDYFVRKLLDTLPGPIQFVALGGGMDTMYFRIYDAFRDRLCGFFDVDFDSVVKKKKNIYLNLVEPSWKGKFVIPEFVAADLRSVYSLSTNLKNAKFDVNIPTIFYSECVLNYLSLQENDSILNWINETVPQSILCAYEQTNPDDSFGRIMLEHFEKNGCPIQGIQGNGSIELQCLQIKNAGFEKYFVMNAWDAFLQISKNDVFPIPKISQLLFDEYEALIGTCLHYSIRIGTTKNLNNFSSIGCFTFPGHVNNTQISNYTSPEILTLDNPNVLSCRTTLKLKGQVSILHENTIYLIGGSDQTSQLQSSIVKLIFSLKNGEITTNVEKICENELLKRSYASAVYCDTIGSIFVHGGRKAPVSPRSNEVIQIQINSSIHISPDKITTIVSGNSKSKEEVQPCRRWRHSLSYYNRQREDGPESCLFLFGGKTTQEYALNDSWIYQIATKSWVSLIESTSTIEYPTARHSHAAVTSLWRDSIFIIGGVSANDTSLCDDALWEYNYNENFWTKWNEFEVNFRRVGHVAQESRDTLYVIGGYGNDSGTSLNTFIITINFDTKKLRKFELELYRPQLFLPFDFSAHILRPNGANEDYLVVVGGGGNCFSFGSHYNSDCICFKLPLSQV